MQKEQKKKNFSKITLNVSKVKQIGNAPETIRNSHLSSYLLGQRNQIVKEGFYSKKKNAPQLIAAERAGLCTHFPDVQLTAEDSSNF